MAAAWARRCLAVCRPLDAVCADVMSGRCAATPDAATPIMPYGSGKARGTDARHDALRSWRMLRRGLSESRRTSGAPLDSAAVLGRSDATMTQALRQLIFTGACMSRRARRQRDDYGKEHETGGGGRGVLRRSRTRARLGRRDRGAVELRAARQSAERRRRDARAEGVLRPANSPTRARGIRISASIRSEAGAEGTGARGAGARTRRGRGEARRRRHAWLDGGGRAGQAAIGAATGWCW